MKGFAVFASLAIGFEGFYSLLPPCQYAAIASTQAHSQYALWLYFRVIKRGMPHGFAPVQMQMLHTGNKKAGFLGDRTTLLLDYQEMQQKVAYTKNGVTAQNCTCNEISAALIHPFNHIAHRTTHCSRISTLHNTMLNAHCTVHCTFYSHICIAFSAYVLQCPKCAMYSAMCTAICSVLCNVM